MPKIVMVYPAYMDRRGEQFKIGGVETYLRNLSIVATEAGYKTEIIQLGDIPFKKTLEYATVLGHVLPKFRTIRTRTSLYRHALTRLTGDRDILLFGSDLFSCPTNYPRVVSINHGISWDLHSKYLPLAPELRIKNKFLFQDKKGLLNRYFLKLFMNVANRVCVDYNMVNWYHTQVNSPDDSRIWVIPNFSHIVPEESLQLTRHIENGPTKVLFARRFEDYRGAILMAEMAKECMAISPDIFFTFAGEGPMEQKMRSIVRDFSDRVSFIKYYPQDTNSILLQHHISVIPSLGSEGTSLSALEAMGAGNLVICSCIGGLTQIVIDGYNGVMCIPKKDSFLKKIIEFSNDRKKRLSVIKNGYQTAKDAFSYEYWKEKWIDVLKIIENCQ